MHSTDTRIATAEAEERHYLAHVTERLQAALQHAGSRLKRYARDIQEQKTYLWESKADMDHVEKAFTRQVIAQSIMTGETVRDERGRLHKLLQSPYFGRFDFHQGNSSERQAVYVGVHHFSDESDKRTLVYDWRAPVSSMFYDHEIGPATYRAPSGEVKGEIRLKRQFRIRSGRMEFMLESAVNIVDDVLQEELSRSSDEGMKHIVATIQRDQNAIIRNVHAPVLIIQGVAGSGKTSIALHRIAFLLYHFKESLTSSDILIISPNRVFADYISNVLPELGEESIPEVGMETLAAELLGPEIGFQTFLEQTAALLDSSDEQFRRRIATKSSAGFLDTLDEYADHVERTSFEAEDVELAGHSIPAGFIAQAFARYRGVRPTLRIAAVVKAVEQHLGIHYNHEATALERNEIRRRLRKMLRRTTLRSTYRGLFSWMGEPGLFKASKGRRLEYSDVFPLIYLTLRLEGIDAERRNVKHLLIDEMQDYTPVQYAVIARLFTCRKTILGDARQSVNPYSASNADEIQKVFRHASCVKLCKSYRSTYEITRFAQRISPDPDLVAIERHGDAPVVHHCRTPAEELDVIARLADEFARSSRHRTLGMICKTQGQAQDLFDSIRERGLDTHLLTTDSRSFAAGVTVCTAHMVKGLEFDEVIVPHVTSRNYQTPMDRSLLYVACTRAMHRLTLTCAGERTSLIADDAGAHSA